MSERSPPGPASTPDPVTAPDGRHRIGGNPAGGDAGTADAPREPPQPPPAHWPDEQTSSSEEHSYAPRSAGRTQRLTDRLTQSRRPRCTPPAHLIKEARDRRHRQVRHARPGHGRGRPAVLPPLRRLPQRRARPPSTNGSSLRDGPPASAPRDANAIPVLNLVARAGDGSRRVEDRTEVWLRMRLTSARVFLRTKCRPRFLPSRIGLT